MKAALVAAVGIATAAAVSAPQVNVTLCESLGSPLPRARRRSSSSRERAVPPTRETRHAAWRRRDCAACCSARRAAWCSAVRAGERRHGGTAERGHGERRRGGRGRGHPTTRPRKQQRRRLQSPPPYVTRPPLRADSESLCPDCIHFIEGVWWKAYNTQGLGYGKTVGDEAGIISFNNVVYGNARISPDNATITCQHGAQECLYNTLEACVLAHYPAVKDWLPMNYCLESAISGGTISTKVAQKCATAGGLTWKTLDACWKGAEGHALDVAAAFTTAALVPPHK